MVRRLLFWIIDHPLVSTVLVVALTGFFALQLPRLQVDVSVDGLMLKDDPARAFYEEFKEKFGSDNLTVIVVKADDVFAAPTLRFIRRLSDAAERLEGVSRVESLTTVNTIKSEEDWVNTGPLVGDQVPEQSHELERIRAYALTNPIFVGNLVSANGTAAAINVYVNPKPWEEGFKTFNQRFSAEVDAILQREAIPDVTAYQIGVPVTKATLSRYVQEDQVGLVPIAVGVIFIALLFVLPTRRVPLIPIITSLLSVVWTLGLMAIVRSPVNVLTATVPALLITIGFTEDVHMISHYYTALRSHPDRMAALKAMASAVSAPIFVITATTVFGFASLCLSQITMVHEFGVVSTVGLVSNFLITIAAVPTMLFYLPLPKHVAWARPEHGVSLNERFSLWLVRFDLRWAVPIVLATVAVSLLCLNQLFTLKVNNDFISYFKERSVIRQRVQDIHEVMAGTLSFSVVVDSGRDHGIEQPDMLWRMHELQEFLARYRGIDKTVSIVDYLKRIHQEMDGATRGREPIPRSSDLIAQYLLLLDWRDVQWYVDYPYRTANIIVRHNITSSWELSRLLSDLDGHAKARFPGDVTVRYTGEGILINNAADYMVRTMANGFAATFLGILIVHSVLFMSLAAGFLSLLPNLPPLLATLGLMGVLGIPLNVGTTLVAEIILGIVVDDTVHLMNRYKWELRRAGRRRLEMLFNTLRFEGRPIIISALVLAAGFLVLTFSNFVPTTHLGALSAVAMLVALVAELALAPLLMLLMARVIRWEQALYQWLAVGAGALGKALNPWKLAPEMAVPRSEDTPRPPGEELEHKP